MPKLKTHKGLLKRVKVTAKGKVKFKGAYSGHLRSKKSGTKLRHLRGKKLLSAGDAVRISKMLHHAVIGEKG